ncbi:MAG: PilZ domain-containing protein [Acidobacteria bacterium]|nr:PilZ domain-containing protein [Acidobacteriota bacterium]
MNTQGTVTDERRVDRRYKVSFRVHVKREESPEIQGEVTDLSAGGCFVTSEERVNDGDLVSLRFDIPGHEALVLWGNVVFWVSETGFGVRFGAYSQGGARERLLDLLGPNP